MFKDAKKKEITKYLQLSESQEFNPVKTDLVLLLVDDCSQVDYIKNFYRAHSEACFTPFMLV